MYINWSNVTQSFRYRPKCRANSTFPICTPHHIISVLTKMTLHSVWTLDRPRVEQFRSFADATKHHRANSHHDIHAGRLTVEIRRAVSYRHSFVRKFTFDWGRTRLGGKKRKEKKRRQRRVRVSDGAAAKLRIVVEPPFTRRFMSTAVKREKRLLRDNTLSFESS